MIGRGDPEKKPYSGNPGFIILVVILIASAGGIIASSQGHPNGPVAWPHRNDLEFTPSSSGFDHHPTATPLPRAPRAQKRQKPNLKTRMIDLFRMIIPKNKRF
jgi:hypothetical protein